MQKDLSRYYVRPTDGGDYIVNSEPEQTVSAPDYRPSAELYDAWVCGNMWRKSEAYSVSARSADSRFMLRPVGREAFFAGLPRTGDELKKTFAGFALENAETIARGYPPQMHDLVVVGEAGGFIGGAVAMMVQDGLYSAGAFWPLNGQERAAAGLPVSSDTLPGREGARV